MNVPGIIGLEEGVLRCLCAGIVPIELRLWATQELTGYVWQSSEHEVIYEAVTKIRGQDATSLRDQLPAQATRMGFPDIEWNSYLNDPDANTQNLQEMTRELLAHDATKRRCC